MSLYKFSRYLAYALGLAGAIIAFIILLSSDTTYINDMSGNLLYVAYTVLGVVLLMVSIFVAKGLLMGNLKRVLITIGLFLAVLLISYVISSGTNLDLKPFNDRGLNITETISRNVGAGLYAFYILAIVAIVSTLISSAKNLLNN